MTSYAFSYALGLPALIVFASRFSTGRASRTTKYRDVVAAALFVVFFYLNIHDYIPLFTARPIGELPDAPLTIFEASAYVLVFVALCVKTRKRKHAPRAGLGWIAAGYGIGFLLARVGPNYLFAVINRDAIRSLHGIFDGALFTSLRSETIVA